MHNRRLSASLMRILFLAACAPAPAPTSPSPVPPTAIPASAVPIQIVPTSVPPTDTPAPTARAPGFDKLFAAAQQEGELSVIALPHYRMNYGVIVFEANREVIETLLEDWPVLLNADYQIAVGGYPAQSSLGMMTGYSASLANGGALDDTLPGLRYFQDINRKVYLSPNFTSSRDSVASGRTPLVLTWDYLALADQMASGNITIIVPKTGLIAGLYAQGISAYAPHPNAARLWMEFLYSDEGQLLCVDGLGHPVRFADLYGRGLIPEPVLAGLLPPDPYLDVLFPAAEQMSAADRSIIGGWRTYVR